MLVTLYKGNSTTPETPMGVEPTTDWISPFELTLKVTNLCRFVLSNPKGVKLVVATPAKDCGIQLLYR